MSARSHDRWLAATVEAPLEPDLPICDAHHHLLERRPEAVVERYMLDELLADAAAHNVVSTVAVECGVGFRREGPLALRPVGEVELFDGIATMSASGEHGQTRVAAAIVATADLRLGDAVADVLDALAAAGGGRLRGIRMGAAHDPDASVPDHRTDPGPHLLARDDFRAGFAQLAPRGLTFDAWCYHPQIPEVTALARSFPATTIVLDHFGGPLGIGPYAGKADQVHATWWGHIRELARCPNVVAKLGGLAMPINGFGWHRGARPPTSEELVAATRPYHERTITAFGVDRCMFESNFPVDRESCSYTVLWNAFKRMTAGCTATEKAALFHDTAARVYRVGSTSSATRDSHCCDAAHPHTHD